MEVYLILTKHILNYYEDIIVLSKYVYLSPKSSKVCKKSAEFMVRNYVYREELYEYVTKLELFAFKMKNLRKGFYCSLCSVKNQKFIDKKEKRVTFSNGFCQYLVENSIEQIFYRTSKFLPTMRHINTVLDCKDGEQDETNFKIEMEEGNK